MESFAKDRGSWFPIVSIALMSLILVSCRDHNDTNFFTVTFVTNGGTSVAPISADEIADVPVSSKNSNALEGWYSDSALVAASKVAFPFSPTADCTLYARWIPATEGLEYWNMDDGYTVLKGSVNPTGNVIVPEYWNGKKVIAVKDHAFDHCTKMTSVQIPKSVLRIENGAFLCCYELSSITFPDRLTSIGSMAFYGCGLTSVVIPDSLASIGSGAFSCCDNLSIFIVGSGNTSYQAIDGILFNKAGTEITSVPPRKGLTSYTIPDDVTAIGSGAFSGCYQLTSLKIPADIASIGSSAFMDCSGLTSLTLPSGITSIGSATFFGCSKITSLTIPNGVTSIGINAFAGAGLTSLTIPKNVSFIGEGICTDCFKMTSITVDPDNPSYKDIGGVLYNKPGTTLIYYPTKNAQASFTLPDSVTTIVNYAFGGSDITSMTINKATPPSAGSLIFINCSKITVILVPAESVETYKRAKGWADYAQIVVSL